MTVCEECGSQDVSKSGRVLTCNECGWERDYSGFKKFKPKKGDLILRY